MMKVLPYVPIRVSAVAALSVAAMSFARLPVAAADPASWRGQSVTEFASEDGDGMAWQIVNDGVMGGLSQGQYELTDSGTLLFRGDLSLDNNGGFSMVRSRSLDAPLDLSRDLGILLRVKGDGRTYQVRLESDARFRGMPVSFSGEFSTLKGKWHQVKIPFSSFEGSWRGTDLPKAVFNPAAIQRVGLILADKQAGPFALEVDWVRTYGKGQGPGAQRSSVTKKAPSAAPGTQSKQAEVPESGAPRLMAAVEADGRFSVLKQALDAAGLTVFFQWDNPLTVFAPTNEAFAKLPEGTVETLLKPENKTQLIALLSRHVSPGSIEVADALKQASIEPVKGAPIEIALAEGRIRVGEATLLEGDIQCRDGVIHVLDSVLLQADPSS